MFLWPKTVDENIKNCNYVRISFLQMMMLTVFDRDDGKKFYEADVNS